MFRDGVGYDDVVRGVFVTLRIVGYEARECFHVFFFQGEDFDEELFFDGINHFFGRFPPAGAQAFIAVGYDEFPYRFGADVE